ncbi:conserved hypothetical protein [Neospora caninum Liverpool]|uniref:Formin FRM3 n=1 Tax=Neospora caninum (strain Liverpool) TaxID=572307 RepID=F0VD26_NEOCL|nr:conserved hypothetical protein [Neospora caninum Liverpool]CBZ51541.1 conserved hypothetical protein [Neospora caninum Liverpool]CEL65491.1 TPA: formin FRM3 [Neospora caninum Liverpool]|eukprot:XP_003881574.1 conserved hypothetical protein [Neospora caninum Liverpool]
MMPGTLSEVQNVSRSLSPSGLQSPDALQLSSPALAPICRVASQSSRLELSRVRGEDQEAESAERCLRNAAKERARQAKGLWKASGEGLRRAKTPEKRRTTRRDNDDSARAETETCHTRRHSTPLRGTRLLTKHPNNCPTHHAVETEDSRFEAGSASRPPPAMESSRLECRGRRRAADGEHARGGDCRTSRDENGDASASLGSPARHVGRAGGDRQPSSRRGARQSAEEEEADQDGQEPNWYQWRDEGDFLDEAVPSSWERGDGEPKGEGSAGSAQQALVPLGVSAARQGLHRSQSQAFCRPASLRKPRLLLRHPSFPESSGAPSPLSFASHALSSELSRSAHSPGDASAALPRCSAANSSAFFFSSSLRRSSRSRVCGDESEGAAAVSSGEGGEARRGGERRGDSLLKARSPSFFRYSKRQSPSWDRFCAFSPTAMDVRLLSRDGEGEDRQTVEAGRQRSPGNLTRLMSPWSRSWRLSEAGEDVSGVDLQGARPEDPCDPGRNVSLPSLHSRQSWRRFPPLSPTSRLRSTSPFSSSPLVKARELWRRLSRGRSSREALENSKCGGSGSEPPSPAFDRTLSSGDLPLFPTQKSVSVVSPSFWSFSSPASADSLQNSLATLCSSVAEGRGPRNACARGESSPESLLFASLSAGAETDLANSGDKTSLSRSTLAYTTCVQSLGEESASEAKEDGKENRGGRGAKLRRSPEAEMRRGATSPSSLSVLSQSLVFTEKAAFLRRPSAKAGVASPSASPRGSRFYDVSPSLLRSLSPSPVYRGRSVSSGSFADPAFLREISDPSSPLGASAESRIASVSRNDLSWFLEAAQTPSAQHGLLEALQEAREKEGQGDKAARLARLETAVRAVCSLQGDAEALQLLSKHASRFLAEGSQHKLPDEQQTQGGTYTKTETPEEKDADRSSPLHLVDMASLFSAGKGDARPEEADEETDRGGLPVAHSFRLAPGSLLTVLSEEPSRWQSAPETVLAPAGLRQPAGRGVAHIERERRTGHKAAARCAPRRLLSLFPLPDLSPSASRHGEAQDPGLFSCPVLRTRTYACGLVTDAAAEGPQGDSAPFGPPTPGPGAEGLRRVSEKRSTEHRGEKKRNAGDGDDGKGDRGDRRQGAGPLEDRLPTVATAAACHGRGDKEENGDKKGDSGAENQDSLTGLVLSAVQRAMSMHRDTGGEKGEGEASTKQGAKQNVRLQHLLLQLENLSETLKTAIHEQQAEGVSETEDSDKGASATKEAQEKQAAGPDPVADAGTPERASSRCPELDSPASPPSSTGAVGEAGTPVQGPENHEKDKRSIAHASFASSPSAPPERVDSSSTEAEHSSPPKRLADVSVQTDDALHSPLSSSQSLSSEVSKCASPSTGPRLPSSSVPGAAAASKPCGKGKPSGPPPGALSATAASAKAAPEEAAGPPGQAPSAPKKGPGKPPGAPKAPTGQASSADVASKKGGPGPPPGAGKGPPGGKGPPVGKGPPGGKGPPPGKGGGPKAKGVGGLAGPRFLIPEKHVPKPPPGFKAATKLQWTPLPEDKVSGTVFEGLLDRYSLASPSAHAESEDARLASSVSAAERESETRGAAPQESAGDERNGKLSPPCEGQGASEAACGQTAASGAAEKLHEDSKRIASSGAPSSASPSFERSAESSLRGSEKRGGKEGESKGENGAVAADAGSETPFSSAPLKQPFRYRLDFVQLFDLFYHDEKELLLKAKKSVAASPGENGGPAKKNSGVLDAKASQNVEICLKKYKLSTVDDFKALAAQIDDPTTLAIDSNLADNITQYWPEPSAAEALKAKTPEEVLHMPAADQLYFTLIKHVSLGSEKLNFFLQRRAVDEELESKREKLNKYCQAISHLDNILDSDAFKGILGLVVRLGNCVNRGSKEGFGFKLKDFVGQLASCTSKDRSTNLFRVLVQTVLEQNPAACEEMRVLQEVDAAKGTDLKDLLQFGDIEKKLSAWTKQIGDRRSAFGGAAGKMEKWIESREALLGELKKKAEDAEDLQLRLRGLMGLTKADCVWPEPLRWFGQFYSHFETTAKEYRGAKDRDRQKAEREAKKKNDVLRRASTIAATTISPTQDKPTVSVPFRPSVLDPALASLPSGTQSRFPPLSPSGSGGASGGNFFSGVGAPFQSSSLPLQRYNTYANHGNSGKTQASFHPLSPLSPGAASKSGAKGRRAGEAGKLTRVLEGSAERSSVAGDDAGPETPAAGENAAGEGKENNVGSDAQAGSGVAKTAGENAAGEGKENNVGSDAQAGSGVAKTAGENAAGEGKENNVGSDAQAGSGVAKTAGENAAGEGKENNVGSDAQAGSGVAKTAGENAAGEGKENNVGSDAQAGSGVAKTAGENAAGEGKENNVGSDAQAGSGVAKTAGENAAGEGKENNVGSDAQAGSGVAKTAGENAAGEGKENNVGSDAQAGSGVAKTAGENAAGEGKENNVGSDAQAGSGVAKTAGGNAAGEGKENNVGSDAQAGSGVAKTAGENAAGEGKENNVGSDAQAGSGVAKTAGENAAGEGEADGTSARNSGLETGEDQAEDGPLERTDARQSEETRTQEEPEEDAANLMASVDEEGRGLAPRIMAAWAQARSPHLGRYQGRKRGGRGLVNFPAFLRDKTKKTAREGAHSSHSTPSPCEARAAGAAAGGTPLPSCPAAPAAGTAPLAFHSVLGVSSLPAPSGCSSPTQFMFPFSKVPRPTAPSDRRARSVPGGESAEPREHTSEDVGKTLECASAASLFVSASPSLGPEKKGRDEKAEVVQKGRGDKATAAVPRSKAALPSSPAPANTPRCQGPRHPLRSVRAAAGEPSTSGPVPFSPELDKEWVRCGGGYCRQSDSSLGAGAASSAARGQHREVGRGPAASSHSSSALVFGAGGSRASLGRQAPAGADEAHRPEALPDSAKLARRRSHGAEETETGKAVLGKVSKMSGKGFSAGNFQSAVDHQASRPLREPVTVSERDFSEAGHQRESNKASGEAELEGMAKEAGAVDQARKRMEATRDGETGSSALERKECHTSRFCDGGRGGAEGPGKDFERSAAGDSVRKVRTRVTGGREGSIERQATNPYIAANVPRHPRRCDPGGRGTLVRNVLVDFPSSGSGISSQSANGSGHCESEPSDAGEVAGRARSGCEPRVAAVRENLGDPERS